MRKLITILPIALAFSACAPHVAKPDAHPKTSPETRDRFGNITVLDSTGTTRTYQTTEAGGVHTGHQIIDSGAVTATGAAASGAAVSGNPVLVGGSDGTSARSIATNSSGQQVVVGAGAAGSTSGGVVSVQGVTSMTPIQVGDNSSTLSVDDGGGSLTVDGTVAVSGTVAVTDNSSSLTVDGTVSATATGAAADGAAVSGNPIRIAGSDGTNTQDMLTDSSGRPVVVGAGTSGSAAGGVLTVQGAASMTPVQVGDNSTTLSVDDGAGSLTVDGTITEAASLVDDAAFTPASSYVSAFGFTLDDTLPDSINEGDIGILRGSARRELYVQIRDAAGNERGLNIDSSGFLGITDGGGTLSIDDGGGAITVDGTVAVSGTVAVTDNSSTLSIDDGAGSITVDGTVTATGGAAHDAAVSGNPNLIGARASAAVPTSVSADGDAVDLWALRSGALATVVTAGGALIGGDATNGMDVDVTRTPTASTVYYGQTTVTTSGTEVTLGTSQALTQGCWVKALWADTGFIYVGLNGVTTSTGYQLDAGETVFIPIADRNTIYIDSSVNAEGVSYVCY